MDYETGKLIEQVVARLEKIEAILFKDKEDPKKEEEPIDHDIDPAIRESINRIP